MEPGALSLAPWPAKLGRIGRERMGYWDEYWTWDTETR